MIVAFEFQGGETGNKGRIFSSFTSDVTMCMCVGRTRGASYREKQYVQGESLLNVASSLVFRPFVGETNGLDTRLCCIMT